MSKLISFLETATPNGKALFPLTTQARSIAYAIAHVLAPFELLLFALGITVVARQNRS